MASMPSEINELLRNHVKDKLGRGEVVASMTVRLIRGVEIARIAKTAGFDSLYVDLEHASFSLDTTGQICIAALEAGITPLVRVPGIAAVSRVLDGGALGVIAPHVQSADDARAYVAAAKFPPLGHRSAAGPLPHLHYRSFPAVAANAALNAATLLIVQFESEEALSQADAIAAVEGVDLVMIGSNDLLADWGLAGQYEHARLRDAYARTIAACRKHGKHVGVGGLASRPDLAAEFVRMGARYVSTGTDLGFLLAACAAKAREVRDITFRGIS
ncbi:MAG TPA: aldolase/citrate lyase family protein [Xanthobacteraceae bacterium]